MVPAFRERGGAELDWARGIPHRPGAYTFTTSGTSARRAFPGLDPDEQVRHKGELVYPNLFLSLACDHAAVFILEPAGPARTDIVCHFLFEPYEISKVDFDPRDASEFWDLVNRQDWAICEAVQQGISARVHAHGYYAPMEDFNLDIRRYVLERIGDAVGADVTDGVIRRASRRPRPAAPARTLEASYLFLFGFGMIAYVQPRSITVASVQMMPRLGISAAADRLARDRLPHRLHAAAVPGRRARPAPGGAR